MMKAVRGATTVEKDTAEEIISSVIELVDAVFEGNGITEESAVSILFSITEDLQSINPAAALRTGKKYGLVPLFCSQEPKSEGMMEKVVRILVTWNCEDNRATVPCYMKRAASLRPDLARG